MLNEFSHNKDLSISEFKRLIQEKLRPTKEDYEEYIKKPRVSDFYRTEQEANLSSYLSSKQKSLGDCLNELLKKIVYDFHEGKINMLLKKEHPDCCGYIYADDADKVYLLAIEAKLNNNHDTTKNDGDTTKYVSKVEKIIETTFPNKNVEVIFVMFFLNNFDDGKRPWELLQEKAKKINSEKVSTKVCVHRGADFPYLAKNGQTIVEIFEDIRRENILAGKKLKRKLFWEKIIN